MKFAAGRLVHGALLLLAVSFAAFAFAQFAPGDYYSGLAANPTIAPETVEALRQQAGLHRPFLTRFVEWLASAGRGDFGVSLAYGGPVAPLIAERIRNTLLLTGSATVVAWLLAAPIGIWAATRRGFTDVALRVAMAVLLLIPDLLLAIVLLAVAVQTGWFPAGGMQSPDAGSMTALERLRDTTWRLVLPAAVLAIGMLPVLVRHVRAAVQETMNAPFALAARAHGIPVRRRLFRHILPVAANPLIGLFGLSLGTLLSASLLVEVVMGWPGLGPFLVDAILARDIAVVLSAVVLSAAFLIAGNTAADLLLYRIDPRIRRARG
jgi:peptide/nickel transport system permease protein